MTVRTIPLAAGLALMSIGCGSGSSGDGSAVPAAPSSTSPVQPDGSDSVATPCDGFEEQYVGEGLFVSLPTEARGLTGQTTTDAGPIHAASSVDFDLGDGVVITVGRRVSSGVVIFVEADDQDLQRCLMDGSRYDASRDQED